MKKEDRSNVTARAFFFEQFLKSNKARVLFVVVFKSLVYFTDSAFLIGS